MFFDDKVAAFSNLRLALLPGCRIVLMAWQLLEDNDCLTVLRDTLVMGRDMPAPAVGMPGPFGLSDRDQVSALLFFFSSRRRHTRWTGDWSSDVCSSDLTSELVAAPLPLRALPGLALALVLGLAGGVSLGPENPIVAFNVALAAWFLCRPRFRSEERRVGKEGRWRRSPDH